MVRLTDGFADDPVWAAGLGDALDGFGYALSLLKDALLSLMDRVTAEAEPSERIHSLLVELRGIAGRLEGARDAVRLALRPSAGAAPMVRWVERRGASQVALAAVPLELAPLLRDLLFDRVETIVLTSATLAAGGSFDFLAGRLGLDLAPACAGAREVLPSPFNYRDQCLFAIPDDVPEPRDDAEAHGARVAAGTEGKMWGKTRCTKRYENRMPRAAKSPICPSTRKPVSRNARNEPMLTRVDSEPIEKTSCAARCPAVLVLRSTKSRYTAPWSTVIEMSAPPNPRASAEMSFSNKV